MNLAAMLRQADPAFRLVVHGSDGRSELTGPDLDAQARGIAGRLQSRGLEPGATVGILGPNHPRWLAAAFGVWAAGGVAVPLAYPLRVRVPDAVRAHVAALVRAAGCAIVLADPRFLDLAPEGTALDWTETRDGPSEVALASSDPAVVQFTSGSTAAPKGARLSHGAVIAALESLRAAAGHTPEDVQVTWQPFFHDMGLFGFPMRALYEGFRCEVMTTEAFARDPASWFRLAGEAGATVMGAPPSAWAAAARVAEASGERPDLSAVRRAVLGAERIDPRTVDQLESWGSRVGLRRESLAVCYGLAEATVGVAITPPGGIRMFEVDPEELTRGRAAPGEARLVSAGPPMPGIEVRIGSARSPFEEDRVGEVLVRTEALMDGYLGIAPADQPFEDGWLRTGDVGFLRQGELVLTGRSKDLIIVFGRNYAPEDLEWAAGSVPGVRAGRVVAFSPSHGEGEVIVVVEPRPDADGDRLEVLVRRAVADAVGLTPRRVLVVPPDTIPKTTSGKLRRGAVREAYEAGSLGG